VLIQGWFDESGKLADSEWVVFAGLLATQEKWLDFSHAWTNRLKKDRVQSLHTAEAIALRGQFRGWGIQKRDQLLVDLALLIREYTYKAMASTVNAREFRNDQTFIKSFGDPQYAAFETCMLGAVRECKTDGDYLHLICDDEEKFSMGCYKLLNKLKLRHADIRKRIITIAFADDEKFPPLQAADMYAYFCRKEAERKTLSVNSPLHPAEVVLREGRESSDYDVAFFPSYGLAKGRLLKPPKDSPK